MRYIVYGYDINVTYNTKIISIFPLFTDDLLEPLRDYR